MKSRRNFLFLFLATFLLACSSPASYTFTSPSGKVEVTVSQGDQDSLFYSVKVEGVTVLMLSCLGFQSSDGDFATGLRVKEVPEIKVISEQFDVPAGKKVFNAYQAHEWRMVLANREGKPLEVVFRVSDDGVAFRYEIPGGEGDSVVLLSEATSYCFPAETRAWLHPHADVKTGWCETQPSYEEYYYAGVPVGTAAPQKAGWSYPALFQVGSQWALVTESGVAPPFCGTRLACESAGGAYHIAFPQPGETTGAGDPVTPTTVGPAATPWRIIITGSLSTVVESSLVDALALPSEVEDPSFVRPGISSWSWGLLKDGSVNFDTQKQFIDYSALMGWSYCLVDVNWDHQIGEAKMFELLEYARSKNVGLILWYNSSGPWNSTVYTPKTKLFDRESRLAEFQKLSEWGVKGIKVDFWPGDGPSAIQYYYDLLRDAARYRLMVNFHGTTVPRGWSRTFPHLVSMESVRGFEFITFEQANANKAAEHCAILPFTRNVVGPMDFTPVCFGEIPRIARHTSNAFELALGVLFQSGIQHIVETPESMQRQPDFVIDYMKNLPAQWEDIRLIDGFPGKYVVLARKSAGKWFLAGINATREPLTLTLDLSVIGGGDFTEMITDGATPREFARMPFQSENGKVTLTIAPLGGMVAL